jgi:hypothetical protein
MKTLHTGMFRSFICAALMCAVLWVTFASVPAAWAGEDNNPPVLPSPTCDNIQVPPGNEGGFHVYAKGVQIYRWNGASWGFVAPEARLFADPNYQAEIGIHYAGPHWESYSGSKVKASRVEGCPSPDPNAIDWLLLRAVETTGPGVFSSVTYIQRVNTTGGKAPATPGSSVGEVINVPYTAVYYFYRAED